MTGVHFEVDAEAALHELDRLAHGPDIGSLEAVLLTTFAESLAHAHVITGHLKASGHPSSSYDGGTWIGTQSFARYPGIFELARGNHPTMNHPEGGHYFFDPGGEQLLEGVKRTLQDFIEGHHG